MKSVVSNFIWKYIERCGYQGMLAIINVVLARILEPEYFGELAIVNIIVIIGQTMVQTGLSTALIREKEIDEYDYSNMVIASMAMAFFIYVVLFLFARIISAFYRMPALTSQIRIMGLVLFPGALNAVQNSKVVREANYKKLCIASIGSVIVSGLAGIMAAYRGLGTYSLIIQQLSFRFLFCVMLFPITHIRIRKPRFDNTFFSMLRFGWKLMASALLNQLYNQTQTLVVGKKFNSATLGAYNQGYQYPYLVIANINSSLQTVILPEFSRNNENRETIGGVMEKANILSSYIICPILIGLAFVSNNFIAGLLTEKWLVSRPFLILFCVMQIFTPLSTINLQAYNAISRSDICLKNEILKKAIGVFFLVIALICFKTPFAVAVSLVITGPTSAIIDSFHSGKEFSYSTVLQFKDLFVNIFASLIMGGIVYCINAFHLDVLLTLALQMIVGIISYSIITKVFKIPGYKLTNDYINKLLFKNMMR